MATAVANIPQSIQAGAGRNYFPFPNYKSLTIRSLTYT